MVSGPLQAQQTPRQIQLSLYCFGFIENLRTIELRTAEDTFTPVRLSTANIVGPFTVPVFGGLIAFHTEDGNADGNPTRPVVAQSRIPATLERALVVLIPARADAPRPYLAMLIPHTDADFPFGSYQLINLSPHAIRGAIGPARVNLAPRTTEHVNPDATPGDIMPVRFDYQHQDLWQPFTETRWAKTNDRRSIICIYHDARRDRVMLRSIPDRTHLGNPAPASGANATANPGNQPSG